MNSLLTNEKRVLNAIITLEKKNIIPNLKNIQNITKLRIEKMIYCLESLLQQQYIHCMYYDWKTIRPKMLEYHTIKKR